MSLNKEQLRILVDLVHIARTTLQLSAAEDARLAGLVMGIKQGRYQLWPDDRRDLLLLLASTPDGLDPLNRAVIDVFAAEIGVSLDGGSAPSPQLDPTPVHVPPMPPVVVPPPVDVVDRNVLPLVPANGVTAVQEMRNTNSVVYREGDFEVQDAEVHTRPQSFMGQVAIGGKPVSNGPLLQLRQGGEVLFLTKVLSANTQEKNGDKLRCGVLSFNPYDNGVRLIRGGYYGENGLLHRTENVMHILGMDSSGWLSKSREDYSKPQVERCQEYIIREDDAAKEYVFVVCRAGWGARIAASTRTTNMNNPNNFDRSAQIIEPLPGAV